MPPTSATNLRLDAQDSVWLRRELEFIEGETYDQIFPENRGRSIIPTQGNIPDWAKIFTWRERSAFGKAKIVSNMSDDIPRVDVARTEHSKTIKVIADAYGYDIFDIKAAIATGIRLDADKAIQARRAIETETDRILAVGDVDHNLNGLLTLDTVGSITPTVATTKTGGGTNWSAAATAKEISNDITKLINAILTKLQGAHSTPMFQKFRIVMPDANYLQLISRTIGVDENKSLLSYVMMNPYIESIVPWWRTVGAAANGVDDRIVAFPADKAVVAGIVPMEFSPQEPEKRNLEYVVDCVATCGGVVSRYPMAIGYMDAVDVV